MKDYGCSNDELIAEANNFLENLETDLPDFTAYDSRLNAAHLEAFSQAIKDAEETPSDRMVRQKIEQSTGNLASLMESGAETVRRVRYFAEDIFKDSPLILNQFNFKRFAQARKSQASFPQYLRELHAAAREHKDALTAGGLEQETIDNLSQLASLIAEADAIQEAKKDDQPVLTVERQAKYNQVYAYMVAYNKAAKQIYKNQLAKRKRYYLPRSKRGGKKDTGEGGEE